MDCKGRIQLSGLEAAPVGDAPGLPCQEWGACGAQALVLLRPLPGGGPGYGAGGGQLQKGARGRPDVPGCWLQVAPLPHPPGCIHPSGLDGGPGRGVPLADSCSLWGSDISARSPWKRVCVCVCKITARRQKPKRPSAPRVAPHRPCVTRCCCVWQKTHGEATVKCCFLTSPEARGKKPLRAEWHLPLPGSGVTSAGQWRGAAVFFPRNSRSSPKEKNMLKKMYTYSTILH